MGGHSRQIFSLAKIIRDEVIKSYPNASPSEVRQKTIDLFDKNKSKYEKVYKELKEISKEKEKENSNL